MLLFYFVHCFVMFHHFNFTLQIADLQQMAAFGAQESDTLRNRAEDVEREVRRLEKEKCVNEARTKRRVSVHLLINKTVNTTIISAFFFFLAMQSFLHSFHRLLTYKQEQKRQKEGLQMLRRLLQCSLGTLLMPTRE